jgi:hypothetical protein
MMHIKVDDCHSAEGVFLEGVEGRHSHVVEQAVAAAEVSLSMVTWWSERKQEQHQTEP